METFAVTGPIRIGSAPHSEVLLDGEGVLPLHANAGFDGGEYWIHNAGSAGVAINGQPAAQKRTLRHLDVITIGSSVNVIFSTTAADLPVQPRSKRPVPPPPPKMTAVLNRPEAAAPNTIIGPAPGAMPAFRPADADASPNTILGPAVRGVAPKFQPVADSDAPNTIMGTATPGAAPKFRPADPEPDSSPNTIVGSAGPGAMPKFDPAGQDIEAGTPNTIVEPAARGALPKFEAPPSPMEAITQPGVAAPPTPARAKAPLADRPIKGVTFRGIESVLTAPLGRSVIGRGATATIRIASDEVSKVHAVLDVTPTEVTLTDQKSVNGTAVNGKPTTGPRRLTEGDRVSFATFEFRVEFVRKDGSE